MRNFQQNRNKLVEEQSVYSALKDNDVLDKCYGSMADTRYYDDNFIV